MLLFSIAIILLSICATWFVVAALNDNDSSTLNSGDDTNLKLYRLREQELNQQLDSGELDQPTYEENLRNFQKQLLTDTEDQSSSISNAVNNSKPQKLSIVISLLIPVVTIAIYTFIGGGINSMVWKVPTIAEADQSPDDMIKLLEQEFDPESATAEQWYLLGRSYSLVSDFDKAQRALSQALQMEPDNVSYLADFVETSMLKNQGQPVDGIKQLILTGLGRQDHPKLLWLAAVVASYEDNITDQKRYLNKLLAVMQADDPARERVEDILTQIESDDKNSETSIENEESADAQIIVRISIEETLKDKINGQAILFVFAKAPKGPPMPLAVARYPWSTAPDEIVLNDSMAMMPNRKLSHFENVTIVAQISQSGQANASSGDLRGIVKNVSVQNTSKIEILIDEIVE